MLASLERTVVLLYHRHVEHVVLDVTVLRAEAGLERAGLARSVPVSLKGLSAPITLSIAVRAD